MLFGAAPSPFLLNATLQHHLNIKGDWIAKDLAQTLYMDNVVTGTNNNEKAIDYYKKSRGYLREGGMNLRQWTTNSPQLNKIITKDKAGREKIVKY